MSTGEGPLGGGGFFGRTREYGPRGPFGAWPGCGCGALFIIMGVILLVCGGCITVVENAFRF
jgi:hypothetical protein